MDELEKQTLKCEKFSFDKKCYLCKVVKCYDGDTIHCVFKFDGDYKRFVIRMYGYSSPEIRTSDKKEKELALKARDKLSNIILDKIVYLECNKFDKYGRILGIIKLNKNDKESVNDIMLKEDYCVKY